MGDDDKGYDLPGLGEEIPHPVTGDPVKVVKVEDHLSGQDPDVPPITTRVIHLETDESYSIDSDGTFTELPGP